MGCWLQSDNTSVLRALSGAIQAKHNLKSGTCMQGMIQKWLFSQRISFGQGNEKQKRGKRPRIPRRCVCVWQGPRGIRWFTAILSNWHVEARAVAAPPTPYPAAGAEVSSCWSSRRYDQGSWEINWLQIIAAFLCRTPRDRGENLLLSSSWLQWPCRCFGCYFHCFH